MDFKPYKIGKYLLLERIASGGMAEVYRAKASGAGGFEKELAVKKILPSYSSNDDFRRMFEYEARLSNKLTHANIVQIYDFVKPGDSYLLAMEFVDGKNLRQLVNKVKKSNFILPIELSVYIINEVCKGLEYAHAKKDNISGKSLNIIHRDMSPQNIMISYEGAVKIVDFGIAKAKDRVDETRSGVIKGKFGYMSPEQANGESVDHRSDIFSTGIILYELVTGRRLFATENDLATLKLIQECVIPVPSKVNPKISAELEKILLKALTKDTRLRFQTAGLLQKSLQEYLNRKFSSFSSDDVSKVMRNVFHGEILAEKKRFEQAHRQSIPFSQGETRTPNHDQDVENLEDMLEGDQTHSEIEIDTAVTFGEEAEDAEASQISGRGGSTVARNAISDDFSKSENSFASTIAKTSAPKIEEEVLSEETIAKTALQEKAEIEEEEEKSQPKVAEGKRREAQEMGTQVANYVIDEKSGSLKIEDTDVEKMPVLNQKTVVTSPEEGIFGDEKEHTTGNIPITRSPVTNGMSAAKSVTPTPTIRQASLHTKTPSQAAPNRTSTANSGFNMDRAPDQFQTNGSASLELERQVKRPGQRPPPPPRNDYYARPKSRSNMVPFLLIFLCIGITVYLYKLLFSRDFVPAVVKIVSERAVSEAPKPEVSLPAENAIAKPAGECLVRIDSDPSGAEVFINSVKKGVAPLTNAVLCRKDINLEMKLKGYEPVSENIFIRDKDNKILRSLRKIPIGAIELYLSQNADVYLDGLMVGRAAANQGFTVEMRAGKKHRLRLKNDVLGVDAVTEVSVQEDFRQRMVLRLEDARRPTSNKKK